MSAYSSSSSSVSRAFSFAFSSPLLKVSLAGSAADFVVGALFALPLSFSLLGDGVGRVSELLANLLETAGFDELAPKFLTGMSEALRLRSGLAAEEDEEDVEAVAFLLVLAVSAEALPLLLPLLLLDDFLRSFSSR